METPSTHMHVGWLSLVRLPGSLDEGDELPGLIEAAISELEGAAKTRRKPPQGRHRDATWRSARFDRGAAAHSA